MFNRATGELKLIDFGMAYCSLVDERPPQVSKLARAFLSIAHAYKQAMG